ncbi:MAG: 50S ribosomal protein L4 [Candidatus Dormibacteraeota bacterium]|nr:50S ribosomal protein L4 [Candidatus Dormibacteraeota bacterium]
MAAKKTATRTTTRAKAKTATPATARAKAAAAKRIEKEKDEDPLQAPLFDSSGESQGHMKLPKHIFGEEPNAPVMHQAYVRQMANARQGTASTKTRGDVSGGGAKPYRQKGTGRARHGSIREPSMKGGGTVFGPHPRDYSQRMPKQMRRLALRSALSQKAIEGRVRVIDGFGFEEPRTKQAADLITAIGFDDTALIVLPAPSYVVSRSFKNLAGSKIILARNLNIRDLFTHAYLLLTKESIELLEENFGRPESRSKTKAAAAAHTHEADGNDDEEEEAI